LPFERRMFLWVIAVAAFVLLGLSAFAFLLRDWPFTEEAVVKSLEEASSSKVQIGSFHTSYFPRPGCVAQNVVFRHQTEPATPPLITIRQLTVQGSFLGLLRKHVAKVRADGMQIFVPQENKGEFRSSTDIVIDELIADGASLQFAREHKKPLAFSIHSAKFRDVGGSKGMPFEVRLSTPMPPGEVEASGNFGPWKTGDAGATPVSGRYSFQRADLSVFDGIAGMLESKGSFDGNLEYIEVQGSADTPDFTVTSSSHKADLKNQFRVSIDATNGDVSLESVESQFRKTRVVTHGSVAAEKGRPGKTTELDLCSKSGRIQDLLLLFITDDRSPMSGAISFCAHATIPSDLHPFLSQVELAGDFGIDSGNFTKPETQQQVDKLSAESREQDDQDPSTVVSGLEGHVKLTHGTATFGDLAFSVPGAFSQMHGDYNVISHKVDLHGTLKMDSSLSHMAHGPKALILKIMDPFFKRKPKGSEVPVRIAGTYEKPSFGLELGGKKETAAAKHLRELYQVPKK